MSDEDDEPEPLAGEDALALARKGKDSWKAWASENVGREVDFTGVDFTTEENKNISFSGFTFPGPAIFSHAKFQDTEFVNASFTKEAEFYRATFSGRAAFYQATFDGEAEFYEVTFTENARFAEATFNGNASFHGATFTGAAEFTRCTFSDTTSFSGSTFLGRVSLEGCKFGTVPDFRQSEFAKHVTLHGIHIDFRPSEEGDADRYRRLKDLAVISRDHDRQQDFFAYELKAKRHHETTGLALVPNYLFEWTSDFGRSLLLPSLWLFAVWVNFGILYIRLFGRGWDLFMDGLLFSAAQLLPFLSASRGILGDFEKTFSGNWVGAFGIMEGLLGLVFLFLIGLALRNRFRI